MSFATQCKMCGQVVAVLFCLPSRGGSWCHEAGQVGRLCPRTGLMVGFVSGLRCRAWPHAFEERFQDDGHEVGAADQPH